jgi:sterol desaturase/sphingolipid hydroxylase (fatty acid hydroxylase superfamily)
METFINWLLNSSEDFQFYLFFGFLFLLMAVEQFAHFRHQTRKKRWVTNFTITFIAIIVMMVIPVSFISAAQFAHNKHWGLFNFIKLNWIITGLLTLFLRGFISFFTHYLMHKIPVFWRTHRVHHLDTELDVSTTVRFHPFEFIINSVIGVPIILLFAFPVWALMLYELFDAVITVISHSNISFPKKIERIVRYIIVTPDLHRVHHSSYQPETDTNFSAVFPIWDIIFGTYKTKTREPQDKMQLGLEEVRDTRTNNIGWLLVSPFKNLRSKSGDRTR